MRQVSVLVEKSFHETCQKLTTQLFGALPKLKTAMSMKICQGHLIVLIHMATADTKVNLQL